MAGGTTTDELLTEYPQLTREDVLAAIACGAEATRERVVPVPTTPRTDRDTVIARISDLIALLQTQELGSELWIIEPGRLRVRQNS